MQILYIEQKTMEKICVMSEKTNTPIELTHYFGASIINIQEKFSHNLLGLISCFSSSFRGSDLKEAIR